MESAGLWRVQDHVESAGLYGECRIVESAGLYGECRIMWRVQDCAVSILLYKESCEVHKTIRRKAVSFIKLSKKVVRFTKQSTKVVRFTKLSEESGCLE